MDKFEVQRSGGLPGAICLSLMTIWFAMLPAVASDQSWQIDPRHTNAQFSVRHMMISNVKGEFSKITGSVKYDGRDVTKSSVNATIEVSSISTREAQRDEHLKGPDFFDVKKFPAMTFVSKKIERSGDGKVKMVGDLTMHGVTKEVALTVDGPSVPIKDMHGHERIGASATGKINRKDFGLVWNGILEGGGAVVGNEVDISLDVELVKESDTASITDKAKSIKS